MRPGNQSMKRSWFWPAWLAGGVLLLVAFALGACGGDSDQESDHQADHDEVGDEEVVTDLFVVRGVDKGPVSLALLTEIEALDGVVQVEPYIRLRFEGFDVVGVDLGNTNRIMTDMPSPHLTEAALVDGVSLDGESAPRDVLIGQRYADAAGLELGANFQLEQGEEIGLSVVGIFSTDPAELSTIVIMPLELVQELFDLPDQVTHFWVTLASPDLTHEAIRDAQLVLGDDLAVLPREVGLAPGTFS